MESGWMLPSADRSNRPPGTAGQPIVVASPAGAAADALPFLAELRWLINAVVARARHPNGSIRVITRSEFADFEQSLRKLEARWTQRERDLAAKADDLGRREREVLIRERTLQQETRAVAARESVLVATRAPFPSGQQLPPQAAEAVERLRAELDIQESQLMALRAELAERQRFIEASEASLTRKIEAQDHLSALLDQRSEELAAREELLAARTSGQPAPKEKG